MKLRVASFCLLALSLGTLPAMSQTDIYDDGPTNGTTDGWTINFGYAVSDSFSIPEGGATLNGINFAVWASPGDIVEAVEVSFTSNEGGGNVYFDQTIAITQSGCTANQYGYNICNETGTLPEVSLNAGTYWLNLQNAVVNTGDPVYWDENSGPSEASEGSLGTLPAESFTLLGSRNSGTGSGSTPEPASVILFGTGALGVGAFLRRKLP